MQVKVYAWNRDWDSHMFQQKYGDPIVAVKSNAEIDTDYLKEDDNQGDKYVRAFHVKALAYIETDTEFDDDRFRCVSRHYDLSNGNPVYKYERIGYGTL